MREARKDHPNDHLFYRPVGNQKCWFAPEKGWKKRPPGAPKRSKLKHFALAPGDTLREDEKDECCWPPLDVDPNGNVILLTLTFEERMSNVPAYWYIDFRNRSLLYSGLQ